MSKYRPLTSVDEDGFADKVIDTPPFTETIVMGRSPGARPSHRGQVYTNVPHIVVQGATSGYDYGYPGSGPADLAKNILENVLRERPDLMEEAGVKPYKTNCYRGQCYQAASFLSQDFKREFIAIIADDVTHREIPFETVVNWLRLRLPEIAEDISPETDEDIAAEWGIDPHEDLNPEEL